MAGANGDFHFIDSHPGPGGASTDVQRRVHSHAARSAHAKARKQRTLQYQARNVDFDCRQTPKPELEVEVDTCKPQPTSPINMLGAGKKDPFACFARRLNPIEEFLLDYYLYNVVPCESHQRRKTLRHINLPDYLNREFVQLAATNATSLDGLFLVTSRHMSQSLPQKGAYFLNLAIQYKIACARSLMDAITSLERRSAISDATVTLAIFLAQDGMLMDDAVSTKRHLYGAIQMVKHNVALRKTDHSVFLYDLIQKDITYTTLEEPTAASSCWPVY